VNQIPRIPYQPSIIACGDNKCKTCPLRQGWKCAATNTSEDEEKLIQAYEELIDEDTKT